MADSTWLDKISVTSIKRIHYSLDSFYLV